MPPVPAVPDGGDNAAIGGAQKGGQKCQSSTRVVEVGGHKRTECAHCQMLMTWANQRKVYGYMIKRGVEPERIKQLLGGMAG